MLFGDFLSWKSCLVQSHASFWGRLISSDWSSRGQKGPVPLPQLGTPLRGPLHPRASEASVGTWLKRNTALPCTLHSKVRKTAFSQNLILSHNQTGKGGCWPALYLFSLGDSRTKLIHTDENRHISKQHNTCNPFPLQVHSVWLCLSLLSFPPCHQQTSLCHFSDVLVTGSWSSFTHLTQQF